MDRAGVHRHHHRRGDRGDTPYPAVYQASEEAMKWMLVLLVVTGCGTAAVQRPVTNTRMVMGERDAVMSRVIQWCANNHCVVTSQSTIAITATIDREHWSTLPPIPDSLLY